MEEKAIDRIMMHLPRARRNRHDQPLIKHIIILMTLATAHESASLVRHLDFSRVDNASLTASSFVFVRQAHSSARRRNGTTDCQNVFPELSEVVTDRVITITMPCLLGLRDTNIHLIHFFKRP